MKNHLSSMVNKRGYTILELLVAIAISGIFMGTIYSAYISHQRSTLGHEQVSAMQRNLRSAMYYMEKEIRMAGCDPTGKGGIGVTTANATSLSFTEDSDGDGNPTSVTYALDDSDMDGVDDVLERNGKLIAENIDALNFVYLDNDGENLTDDGLGNVTDPENRDKIRSVQVTIVARTGKEDLHYTDSTPSYKNKQDETIFTPTGNGVHFRRKKPPLRTNIKCRNLGL